MADVRQGAIRLFDVKGINVFLHWSWFLFAAFEVSARSGSYSSFVWNVLEYLSLFLIVLLHEFGHALACRQVGGNANQIVLWPLGGVAYVDPPPRPGATLWSIAAGPLVNVALVLLLSMMGFVARYSQWPIVMPNAYAWLRAVWYINFGLLIFNLLPVYPLDGGQILRSLLWFVLGRSRSLMAASVIGLAGTAGFILLAFRSRSPWLGVIALFTLMNSWNGLRQARLLSRLAQLPRRQGFACPWCRSEPPVGNYWKCERCNTPFDTFVTRAACPNCATHFAQTRCLDCGKPNPMSSWLNAAVGPSGF
jgi:Zn-dependent protease